MTNQTASDDDLDNIRQHLKSSYRGALQSDGTAFSSAAETVFADYVMLRINELITQAYQRGRADGIRELDDELKRYDWQLEDSINANDAVTNQINTSIAALQPPTKEAKG
jgi:hypothetical protein